MYNLLVGFAEGEAIGDRVVEHTDEVIQTYIAPDGNVDTSRLLNLPALVMPEIGPSEPQIARVGRIDNLRLSGRNYQFRFVPNTAIPEIPCAQIKAAAGRLDIDDWEFRRTHWAVKDVDLYQIVHEIVAGDAPAPTVFRLPVNQPREHDLVAVMMPFDPRFDSVYDALREAAASIGLRCYRADDIWVHDHIMDDVVSLIWRAQVIISDFTSKSPNVFYETGIAHSLGRSVIPITQSTGDIPFDLRAIRAVLYLANGEGLEHLRKQVEERLRDLVAPR